MKRNLILVFCLLLGLAWYTAVSEAINNPKEVEEHLAKAAEYEEKGIYVDAITEYEGALQYEPENIEISLKMANAYLQTGSSKKFVSICKSIAERYPEDRSALDCLMEYYEGKKDEASAVKYVSQFKEMYPEHEGAQGWMIRLQGSYEELYCRYEEFSEIYHNSMVVKQEGKYGLTDSLGEELVSPEYDMAYPYSEDGLALVQKDGKYLYIDEDGQTRLVVDEIYSNPGMMESDRTAVSMNGMYGYLDEKLEPVTEFIWEELTLISDGMGAAKKDGKWALVNKNGKEKTEYLYEDVIRDLYGFCSRQGRVFVKEQGTYRVVNKKGEAVSDLVFENARCFSDDGYAAVCNDGKWGFVNTDGELMIDYQYEDARSFHNGFAEVCMQGKWGYIDTQGNVAVDPVFETVTAMSEKGTAAVKQEEWTLIQLNLFR